MAGWPRSEPPKRSSASCDGGVASDNHAIPTNLFRLGGFPKRGVPRLAAWPKEPAYPAQLGTFRAAGPPLHPNCRVLQSLPGRALLRVTSNLRREPYAIALHVRIRERGGLQWPSLPQPPSARRVCIPAHCRQTDFNEGGIADLTVSRMAASAGIWEVHWWVSAGMALPAPTKAAPHPGRQGRVRRSMDIDPCICL